MAHVRIGDLLVRGGRIDPVQLQSALAYQRQWGGRLGRAIVRLGFMTEAAVLDEVGRQLGAPVIHLGDRKIPPHVLALVPERIIRAWRVLPLARLGDTRRGPLAVAVSDPGDLALLDEVAFAAGMDVKAVLADDADLEQAIARHLDGVEPPRAGGFAARDDAIDLPDEDG